METPSSTRRVTRLQVLFGSNKMIKESENKEVSKPRSALIDLTNSPIVGLASGNLETPSSSAKERKCCSPGSGEAILRCQVKNLLQMVEEEAEMSLEKRQPLFHVKGVVNSPMNLIAPANTPLMGNELLPPVTASPVHDNFVISQIPNEVMKKQESSNITRSLLVDFSEKSEEEFVVDEVCEAMKKINVKGGKQAHSVCVQQ